MTAAHAAAAAPPHPAGAVAALTGRHVGDLVAGAALLAVGTASFGPVFAGRPGWLAAGGGAVIGLLVATLSAWRRWGASATVAAGIAAYLIFGGALALPRTTIAGAPTLETVQRLLLLAVTSWRDLLTVAVPADSFTGPAVVPYLSGLLCALVGGVVVLRTRRPGWGVLPAFVLLVVGILWGTRQAPWALGEGLAFAAVSLGWLSAIAQRERYAEAADILGTHGSLTARRRGSLAAGGAVLAVVTVGALLLASAVGSGARFVLRDVVEPPLDMRQFASPLTLFRLYERDLRDETLLTVSGMPRDARLRLAVLDAYDGVVYNVDSASSTFQRVGSSIAVPGDHASAAAPQTLEVAIAAYSGVWVPGAGDVRGVRFSGAAATAQGDSLFYNRASGQLVTTAGVAEGSRYDVDLAAPAPVDETYLAGRQVSDIAMPSVSRSPDSVPTTALEFTGSAATPLEQARSLAAKLREYGFYSDGADGRSRSGHTAERINALLTDEQMIGDDEQYAVAMALMSRQLGLPARVVMGFYPEPGAASGSSWDVKGSEAHVWVEIAFDGVGWVAFDPTPDRSKTPQTDTPQPRRDPRPQVLPPPDPPSERVEASKEIIDDQRKPPQPPSFDWWPLVVAGLVVAGSIALLLMPVLFVLWLKRRRRRQRAARPLASDRMSGGWAEVVDRAVDLGVSVTPTDTRREVSLALAEHYPAAGVVGAAQLIDAGVFAEGEPTTADVAAMWAEVDGVLGRMSSSVSPMRRRLAAVSLRSLGVRRGALTCWVRSVVKRVVSLEGTKAAGRWPGKGKDAQ